MTETAVRSGRWQFRPERSAFRRLWTAQTVSLLGSQVSLIAFPLTAVVLLHAGSGGVGLLGAAERLPFLLFGLVAGVLVDRWRPRRVMLAGDWIRAAALALIPVAAWMHAVTLWWMCAIAFVVGVATVFFDIAYQSALTDVVETEELVDANRLLESSRTIAEVSGPGLAAVLLKVASAPVSILVDAFSFAVSALCLQSTPAGRSAEEGPRNEEAGAARGSIRSELMTGLRFIRDTEFLRWNAVIGATWNLLLQALLAVFFVFLARDLKLGSSTVALVVLAGSVGGLAGVAVMGRINKWFGLGPGIAIATCTSAVGGLVLATAGGSVRAALIVGAAYLIINASFPLFDVNVISIRQAITPAHLMSRTTAAMRFLVWGTLPLGALLGGFLGEAIGNRPTIVVLGLAQLLPALLTLVSPIRRIRTMSDVAVGETQSRTA
ncbi:MFS transporter [Streptomyces sp. Li-HN-5-11]|uniref:MFS transporter n=1 Tax=Streptomyces sp. Li-HN-5-11 TaxID=3075432 RepID=UPI0028B1C7C1|nr:MFS transporter [Streptomyces sp. Li-HN-5-11]WNM30384.1 MFS transporter [Streptomyces sp. Li-HN-5-11]